MRFRLTRPPLPTAFQRARVWFLRLRPPAQGGLSILILVSLALALEPETRWPVWALRRSPWHLALGICVAGLLGLGVRRAKSPSARFKLLSAAIVVFACMTDWGLSSESTLAWLSVAYLPLIFLASTAHARAPTFVLGFLFAALAFCQFGNLQALLALGAFLLARDFGRVSLKRQCIALLGTGLIAGFLGFSLSFDLAATFEYDPNYAIGFERGYFVRAHGFIGDAPSPRWTRMLTEALLIVACFAHLRGRTWGVLGLVCLLPLLAVQIRAAGIEYPFYSGLGLCFSARHPLRDTVLEKSVTLLAIGPWLWPMLRSLLLRPERSFRESLGQLE